MKALTTLSLLVFLGAAAPFEAAEWATPPNAIDHAVTAQLKKLRITPANPCSDAVFVRRVYLDVIGTLPTAAEARAFLDDPSPLKRSALIDKLLSREEFADYQAMRWCETLRVKSEFPINLWPNAAQAYHRWIRTSIKENKRYDVFARELLTASGSNFRVPQANFYRAVQSRKPMAIAQMVALTMMGCRAENWPVDQLKGMSAFFAQIGYKSTAEWKEEIVFHDASSATTRPDDFASATFPDGTRIPLPADRDPREIFADWLITPKNPYFNRCIVNRIWFWLVGRGIVHEPDDFRLDNPPGNPRLLTVLEHELTATKYDLKRIYRLILNSRTYQFSSIPRTDSSVSAANFAHYPLRRLDAEILIDVICQITGTREKYTSAIPEPFTFMPDDQRAIALPDGSITSSFLELFGRPPRDSGLQSERALKPGVDQRLHLLNSTHIQRKIEQSIKLRALGRVQPNVRLTELYLTILSRPPTAREQTIARLYGSNKGDGGREAWVDLTWALINSPEFLYRH
jgi:hypothetical protein